MFKFLKKLFKRIQLWVEEDVHANKNFETEKLIVKLNKIEDEKLETILAKISIREEYALDTEDMYEEAHRLYPRHTESLERTAFIRGVKWQMCKFQNR